MKPQQGFAALLMIVLVAVGVFGAMAAWVASEPPPSKQSINHQVLLQAKEALLAYVALGSDPANMLVQRTRLPCPDRDGDGIADMTPDIGNCGLARQTALGLLPWKSLGLPPLRDADGECLWYAVSGDFKDASDPTATTAVNADTDGMITVSTEAGQSLATKLVAVIFAPGAKRSVQARSDPATLRADMPCATPNKVAAADSDGYLELGNALAPASTPIDAGIVLAPTVFMQSAGTVDKQSRLNDQLAWITADDYAATATQRNAEVLLQALIQGSVAAGDRLPFAAATPGAVCEQGRYSGFLPLNCSSTTLDTSGNPLTRTFTLGAAQAMLDKWPQQAFYAVTPGCTLDAATCSATTGAALTVSGKPPVKAVLVMRGRPQATQTCLSSIATYTDWLSCVESQTNRNELSKTPGEPAQARTFLTPGNRPVSNDILKELP